MEQSLSWEANCYIASEESFRISQNPKAHYRIHNCPLRAAVLSQINPFNSHSVCLRSILKFSLRRFGLPGGLFPSRFHSKTIHFISLIVLVCVFFFICYRANVRDGLM
jgi:hypothetical protein